MLSALGHAYALSGNHEKAREALAHMQELSKHLITGGGWINGTPKATLLGLAPSVGLPGIKPETTLSVVGDRTIMTSHGILTLRFTAVFDTVRGEFTELLRVTNRTGDFSEPLEPSI